MPASYIYITLDNNTKGKINSALFNEACLILNLGAYSIY